MPLIADGAMGTELLARSGFNGPPAQLNLLHPELVLQLHREYVAAGAKLLVANTLAGSPRETAAGVKLARACSGATVAASITEPGPEVVRAAVEADLIILEAVTSLTVLEARVEAVRRLSSQPLLATLSFGEAGRLDGLAPAEVARRVSRLGLVGWGYGCGFGPRAARHVMAELRRAAPNTLLIAKPSLGLPRRGSYAVTPAELAAWASHMAALGVEVIGACCGSTPAHIEALAAALVDSESVSEEGF
jgi:methionine synthase I (cobalamin-dependent)